MTHKDIRFVSRKCYNMPDTTPAMIEEYARQVAGKFKPNKIILFGSFAYGEPTADSDVDLLVVMPCANEVSQAVRIRLALKAPFPMDLIVRTPSQLRQRIKHEDWFLREITTKGVVLYEKSNLGMGAESPDRHSIGKKARKRKAVRS